MEFGAWVGEGNKSRHDRRADRKYPVTLPLEYRIYGGGITGTDENCRTGSGRTLSMSSVEVLFEADRELREGLDVELFIAWPASLGKSAGLTLRIRGFIVRADQTRAQLTMKKYEFRTRSLPVTPE